MAEIATIAALAIAALQFFKFEPNTLDNVSDDIKEIIAEDVNGIELEIDRAKYKDTDSIAYPLYQAGLLNRHDFGRSETLRDAAMAALDENDYSLAIVAANSIPYDSTKSETLEHIAMEALNKRKTLQYAVVAADLIPYSITKYSVVEKISVSYTHLTLPTILLV